MTDCCLADHAAVTATESAAAELLLCALPPGGVGGPEQSQHLHLPPLYRTNLLMLESLWVVPTIESNMQRPVSAGLRNRTWLKGQASQFRPSTPGTIILGMLLLQRSACMYPSHISVDMTAAAVNTIPWLVPHLIKPRLAERIVKRR